MFGYEVGTATGRLEVGRRTHHRREFTRAAFAHLAGQVEQLIADYQSGATVYDLGGPANRSEHARDSTGLPGDELDGWDEVARVSVDSSLRSRR
ncbi:hypothetical protein [Amycolatopsis sp. PS_44_ISF1]|uniref:hypothetical protein n=1 Tax=Amycolatopsis sp. PS_44_ISF1 TaxID=2974917 RepID=UPI0028DFC5BD|nr:hypothetical protein [Amycolatopsis sp. PS_44_ISF1]MDT8916080.1 hypothetical protein [Amycolatopsis sp. PS_44_ISF1]